MANRFSTINNLNLNDELIWLVEQEEGLRKCVFKKDIKHIVFRMYQVNFSPYFEKCILVKLLKRKTS